MATLTSANAQLTLSVAGIYSSPQAIQGFATDDAFESDSAAQAETMMGVDGFLSAGKIFAPYDMTIHLQADSPSIALFDTWRTQQDAQVDVFRADGNILIPGTGMIYQLVRGYLMSAPAFPAVKKILQPQAYVIRWERITPAPGGTL